MTRLGRLIAPGRTSDVYEFGPDSVVKVSRPWVPTTWAATEAAITAVVHRHGLPTPAVRGVAVIEGRESAVFERVDGPTMWQQVRDGDRCVEFGAAELAEIQLEIHDAGVVAGLPRLADRIGEKIDAASLLAPTERDEAHRLVDSLPEGSAICHGDLHPGNVLMSRRGPIVIDWFDAAVGSPVADFVRSSLLVRPRPGGAEVFHLPGSSPEVLGRFHHHYVERMLDDLDVDRLEARWWEAVLAVSRLSEHAEGDDLGLLSLWRGRGDQQPSPLIEAMSALRSASDERSNRGQEPRGRGQ